MQWLAEICVHRPVFATVIVLFLTVVAGFSFFTLGVDRFPKIDLPTISVRTTNPGAAPEEIETEITDIVEGALNTVPGVEEMRSSSSRGSSNVTLTFNLEKDPDVAFQEIQQKLSTIGGRLPETADPPVAQKSDPDSQPILMYTISAPRDVMELSEQIELLIQKRIENADGVAEVFLWGSRSPRIQVNVSPDRLRAYNLSVTDVTAAIRSQNQESPGGNIIEGRRTLGVRTMSKLTDVEQFNDIVVASRRCHSRSREYLSIHRGERPQSVSGRDRRHTRDRPRRACDYAEPSRRVYPCRFYDGNRRAVYVVVWPDGGGHRGFADRLVHAHAYARG